MLKKAIVLFLLACGIFYVYQKNQPEIPPGADLPRVVDDSALRALKDALPPAIFEKEILPSIEKNERGGLSPEQIDELAEKLEALAKDLGGKAASAVQEAMHATIPEDLSRRDMLGRAAHTAGALADDAADSLKEHAPAMKRMAVDVVQGVVTLFSRFLETVAGVLSR